MIKLWFALMDLICLSQEHQLEKLMGGEMHIGYKCLWWFLGLIEIIFLDGILILHIIVPSVDNPMPLQLISGESILENHGGKKLAQWLTVELHTYYYSWRLYENNIFFN